MDYARPFKHLVRFYFYFRAGLRDDIYSKGLTAALLWSINALIFLD